MRGKLLCEPIQCPRCDSLVEVHELFQGSMDIQVTHNLSSLYGKEEVLLLGQGDRGIGIVRIVQASFNEGLCWRPGFKVLYEEIIRLKKL